jgi:hypothetical protein
MPLRFTKLVQVMYGSVCTCCKKLKTQANLTAHNFSVDLVGMCDTFQFKDRKDGIRSEIKFVIKKITAL